MQAVARQFLRAVREGRSQRAFSRRLGYEGNPVASWENGRRFPTASEALRACRVAGIDVREAFRRFHPATASTLGIADAAGVASWLSEIKGSASLVSLARDSGFSRFSLARWFGGQARPRLPDFFRLVDVITGRLCDLVAELVPIERVPALANEHAARRAARSLAFEEPWTEAVLRVLETSRYARIGAQRPGFIAECLGIDAETEQRCLGRLEAAGVIARRDGRYESVGPLTVDTTSSPEVVRSLKSHWAEVARTRIQAPRPNDLLSYNVLSASEEDLDRIREVLLRAYREIRNIVAASAEVEGAALVNLQLVRW
jgi:transcriptional regulator with XRE-family HTH domain